jgi:hypothetical protein
VILFRLLVIPVRLMLGLTRLGFVTGYRTGRLVGYRRLTVLGAGVAIGLLVAPVPGRELRAALRRWLESRQVGSDDDLEERVRFELSHNPRTWHLPQPQVTVASRQVTLRGDVPDEAARGEMVRAVAALPGVAGVDDRLTVTGAVQA